MRFTVCGCQRPPSGVAIPRAVSSDAICRVDMPDPTSSARRALIWLARSTAAAWLAGASLSAFRPSRTPRTLAARSAALVRDAIISRSCSATAARMCRVSRVACGLSQATNSTPASIMAAMKATLRDSLVLWCCDSVMLSRQSARCHSGPARRDTIPAVRARKAVGAILWPSAPEEAYGPPPAPQQGPRAASLGPESFTPALTCPRRSTRV